MLYRFCIFGSQGECSATLCLKSLSWCYLEALQSLRSFLALYKTDYIGNHHFLNVYLRPLSPADSFMGCVKLLLPFSILLPAFCLITYFELPSREMAKSYLLKAKNLRFPWHHRKVFINNICWDGRVIITISPFSPFWFLSFISYSNRKQNT